MRRRAILLVASLAIAFGCAAYVFAFRYYARMIPLPLSQIDLVYDSGASALAPRLRLNGSLDFPDHKLSTDAGLRAALDHIRSLSPVAAVSGMMTYDGIDFPGWVRRMRRQAIFCTDATLLFMAFARNQGLAVREWWLWSSRGYRDGNAHSLVEFFNPARRRWQVVDALTSTVIRDARGAPVSMADILRRYEAGRQSSLVFDQSPGMARIVARGENSYDTGKLLDLSRTPVLNLKPPTWFATTPKWDLIIAVPVLTGNRRHNPHVFTTKVALVFGALAGAIALWTGLVSFRRPRSGPGRA